MRHAIAAGILLLTACASSDEASRFVVIESESYGCGAAEGLGCGLAIAPVLDAIDDLDGVAQSSVSWDGRYFRVEVRPGADPVRSWSAPSSKPTPQAVASIVCGQSSPRLGRGSRRASASSLPPSSASR